MSEVASGFGAWLAGNALVLVFALLIDAIIGDPPWLWRRVPHPVVLMGKLIGALDRYLNRDRAPSWVRRAAGGAALAMLCAVVGVLTLVVIVGAAKLGEPIAWLIGLVVVTTLLAQRSLHDHIARVRDALDAGDITAARQALSMVVGRQTQSLDESEITRAALESLAENHSDGVIAPAFWFLLGGPAGIAIYKAINTADSMIGHRSDAYRDFGWAAARTDDVVNWVPARLSVFLVWFGAAGAIILRYPLHVRLPSIVQVKHDAPSHASPNAGWPEASYASALGVALGGPRTYATGTVDARYLNVKGRKALEASDIARGLLLFHATCAATTVFVAIAALTGA